MILIEELDRIKEPFNNAVITIGNFDGVHKGHQTLLRETISKAKEIGGTSVAMTFEPHPKKVLNKDEHPPLITIYEQKIELIKAAGIDVLIAVPFTMEFAGMGAREFVCDLLMERLGMKAMVVGKDYYFGKKREGDLDLLMSYSKELHFDLIIPEWTSTDDYKRISSTRIREVISRGEVEKAPDLLGRYYQIRGKVVSGRDRGGKLLGFPTANINLMDELCPQKGVYAVTVECEHGHFGGVANIGYSPTFDDHQFTIEIHILDFDKDIYNQTIRVNMIAKLRDEKKFNGIEELSEQIKKDIEKARKILKNRQQ